MDSNENDVTPIITSHINGCEKYYVPNIICHLLNGKQEQFDSKGVKQTVEITRNVDSEKPTENSQWICMHL